MLDNANKPINVILKEILGENVNVTDEFYKKTEEDLKNWIKANKKE